MCLVTAARKLLTSPFAILAVSLALAAIATGAAVQAMEETDRVRFEQAADAVEDRIVARVATHEATLHAIGGLFAASQLVERQEFRTYIGRFDLARQYPSIQGIGFSRRVLAHERAAFVAATRADGATGFRIWPGPSRAESFPVVYIEPFDVGNRPAVGYDMFAEASLREAMERARDTGRPALSAKAQVVAGRSAPTGFFMYVPVYRPGELPRAIAARRSQLYGFAYSAVRGDRFFPAVLRDEAQPEIAFRVFDSDARHGEQLLYASPGSEQRKPSPSFTTTRSLLVAGRRWTVVMESTPAFNRADPDWTVAITAGVGLMLSLAFFVASRAQTAARATAERAAADTRRSFEQQQRAEDALRRSSRRVQLIVDALPALVSFVDSHERYRFVNAEYEKWFGMPRSEFAGRSLIEVLGEANVARLRPFLDEALSGRSVTYETTLVAGGGAPRSIRGTYTPHLSESGAVEGFVALVTDVTKQKRAETWQRFLAEASRVLSSSLDYKTALEGVTKLSVPMIADCCLVYVADTGAPLGLAAMAHADPDAMERLRELEPRLRLGEGAPYGPDHVFATAVPELVQLSDTATAEPYHEALRSLGFRSTIAVPVRVRDQTVGVILLAATRPLLTFVEDDVSMAEDLSRRTADAIDNARLYAAAQAAVRLRDEFLSIASHELRTPLTPLQLHLEMWQNALSGGDARRRLDTALRQTHKLSKLVESLLDVSRLTTGRMALEPERFDLTQVAREVIERFAPDARSAGCAVALNADEPILGRWDRMRVEQVLSNLLSNAIKYGAGQPIELTLERSDEGAAYLRVTDRGIGITPEDSARIFDRFERAVSPRHYGGMGLGLYIVRQIVEAHSGSIAVESTPGVGSSFTVLLPSLRDRPAGMEEVEPGRPMAG